MTPSDIRHQIHESFPDLTDQQREDIQQFIEKDILPETPTMSWQPGQIQQIVDIKLPQFDEDTRICITDMIENRIITTVL